MSQSKKKKFHHHHNYFSTATYTKDENIKIVSKMSMKKIQFNVSKNVI